MGAFYGNKILKGEPKDSEKNPWTIDDVPKYWREKTQAWLDEHKED